MWRSDRSHVLCTNENRKSSWWVVQWSRCLASRRNILHLCDLQTAFMWPLKATCRWMTVINPNVNLAGQKRLMTRNCCRTNGMYSLVSNELGNQDHVSMSFVSNLLWVYRNKVQTQLILLPVWDYVVLWRGNWCVYLQGLRGWCGYTLTYFILCEHIHVCVLSRDCGIDSWLWYANNQQTTSKQSGNALRPHKEVSNAMIFSIS